MPFPEGRLVYDFKLDDGGVSKTLTNVDDVEEEERKRSAAKVRVQCIVNLRSQANQNLYSLILWNFLFFSFFNDFF